MNKRLMLVGVAVLLPMLALAAVLHGLALAQGPAPQATVGAQAVLGTGFTYQGRLVQGGSPVSGTCSFQFGLWDASSGGSQVGVTRTVASQAVSAGYFTTTPLDFGGGAFNGEARWLAIRVDCRRAATPTWAASRSRPAPYALALPGLWTQQNSTSPNLIGGYSGNSVGAGVVGAAIGGGGDSSYPNRVTGSYGAVRRRPGQPGQRRLCHRRRGPEQPGRRRHLPRRRRGLGQPGQRRCTLPLAGAGSTSQRRTTTPPSAGATATRPAAHGPSSAAAGGTDRRERQPGQRRCPTIGGGSGNLAATSCLRHRRRGPGQPGQRQLRHRRRGLPEPGQRQLRHRRRGPGQPGQRHLRRRRRGLRQPGQRQRCHCRRGHHGTRPAAPAPPSAEAGLTG